MLQSYLLIVHSLLRWVIVIGLLLLIFRSYYGWKKGKPYTRWDERLKTITISTAHLQFLIGLSLFYLSPIVSYFWTNYSKAVHEREVRFFGMEHITMMFVAIVLMTIGGAKSRKQTTDQQKFRTLFIWMTIVFIIIFLSIPWPFLLTQRPYFRW